MLLVFLALPTTLYITLSIQGSHDPDQNDHVINE